jgi:CubicO group peptidase (beta-lactamase class C family)
VGVFYRGTEIVNACAGLLDVHDTRPVEPKSLFLSFSTTKGVAAALLHIAADRGLVEYEWPVASYWPAFAQNGKAEITVAQAMSHQAGLHRIPDPLTTAFVADWQGGLDYMAALAPAWTPGTVMAYHALTYAWIVGGILEHVTGRTVADLLRTWIAEPLGIEDEMYIGIPDGLEDRLAVVEAPAQWGTDPTKVPDDHPFWEAVPKQTDFTYNDMAIRKACLPSANGHFTARALARMYGALANGGALNGTVIVSGERIPHMQRILVSGIDHVMDVPMNRGIGFTMGGQPSLSSKVLGPRETAFGHKGAGGSVGFADPAAGLGVGVTLNLLQPSSRQDGPTLDICTLIRDELGHS